MNTAKVTGSTLKYWIPSLLLVAFAVGCATTPAAITTHGDYDTSTLPGLTRTELDRYVATPDPHYAYTLLNTIEGQGFTAYIIDLTSQKWRTEAEVSPSVWKHYLTVVRPHAMDTSTALLYIGGGSINSPAPTEAPEMFVRLALGTRGVVAHLSGVPNERLRFPDEQDDRYKEKGRTEDEIIAYTWDKYVKTGDETWPLRLPMTKSAVRAMDTVSLFLASEAGGGVPVKDFVVAGGSKRGWTTWTTAVVDARVKAICPIVIDMLNLEPSFEHHWKAYGFWAPAVGDYEDMGIMDLMGDPRYAALRDIVEPYNYRGRLTMPKLMMNASGDQFFLPDSSQFYFDDLPGDRYLRYVPNTGHGMDDTDAIETLGAYFSTIAHDETMPSYQWTRTKNGLRVETDTEPSAVKLWQATNEKTRDFRVDTIGKAYKSMDVKPTSKGVYEVSVSAPAEGWTAYFVELTYPTASSVPLKLTTEVRVTPDVYPYTWPPEKN